jgi:hypothetical protein
MVRIVDRFVLNAHDNTEANANPTNTPVLKENSNFIGRNLKIKCKYQIILKVGHDDHGRLMGRDGLIQIGT